MPENATQPGPRTDANFPAVVRSGELYTAEELCRRLRWKRHAYRQARKLGLRVTKFGSRNYIAGDSVLRFFADLAQEEDRPDD